MLFDTSGVFLDQVTTGAQPDSVVTALGGLKFVSANEGEPSADGTVNPDGTIGIATLRSCNDITPPARVVRRRADVRLDSSLQPRRDRSCRTSSLSTSLRHRRRRAVTLQEANAVATL